MFSLVQLVSVTVSPVQCGLGRFPSRPVCQLFNLDPTALVPMQCSSASIVLEWFSAHQRYSHTALSVALVMEYIPEQGPNWAKML